MFKAGRFLVVCSVALAIIGMGAGTSHATDFFISGGAGFVAPTGDVQDNLLEGGVLFDGRLFVGLSEQFYLGGGFQIGVLAGTDVEGIDITDAGIVFNFEGGGFIYPIGRTEPVGPFIGGSIGFGVLAWDYEPAAEFVFGVDSDNVGFIYFAPEAGADFMLSESVSLRGGFRFMLASYADETEENFIWDFDDGHFVQVYAGLGFSF